MRKLLIGVALVSLVANLAGTIWLIQANRRDAAANQLVPKSVAGEVDRIWEKAQEFEGAYEQVVTAATYPGDDEKKTHADLWRKQELDFQTLRVEYLLCHERPTKERVLTFVNLARGIMFVPDFTTRDIQSDLSWKVTSYGNTAKMEALAEDYYVMARALLKDVK